MNKTVEHDPRPNTTDPDPREAKRARLRALLSQGAALGTTLLMLAASLPFKYPKEAGE